MSSNVKRFGGRTTVRMPASLHHKLAIAAAREGVSLNQFVCAVLAAEMAWTTRTGEDEEARERRRRENEEKRKEEIYREAWRNVIG